MTTRPSSIHLVAPERRHVRSNYKVTFLRVIRSEWIKLSSVRSTWITLVVAAFAVVVIGVLVSMLSDGGGIGGDGEAVYDSTGNSLLGGMIAQFVLGVLGAVLITSEYSTGQIKSTFTAVPKRLPVLWAKVIVVAGATFTTMIAAVSAAFFAGQAVYAGDGVAASISDPGVPRALLGDAFGPAAIAVKGMAIGAMVRHTAMTLGLLFGLLFVAPLLVQTLGGVWADISAYLPSNVGEAMMSHASYPEQLSPLAGFGVLAGWDGVLLTGAAISLKRRDA